MGAGSWLRFSLPQCLPLHRETTFASTLRKWPSTFLRIVLGIGEAHGIYVAAMPLYAFGSNGSGQLGIGHRDDTSVPTLHKTQILNQEARPMTIRGGGNHTIIVYSPGEVAVCGNVLLGLKAESHLESVPVNLQAKYCAANWRTVITCTESSHTFLVWGFADGEELGGVAKEIPFCSAEPWGWVSEQYSPDRGVQIVDVASGLYHTVVVMSNGDVWGWGSNRKGQLGEVLKGTWSSVPSRINRHEIGFKVKRAACGREFTYLVGDPKEGRHCILGGRGSNPKWNVTNVTLKAPKRIPAWKDIGANWGGIFVLFESGEMVSWGRNDHGQMCPSGLPPIKKMACGSEHVMAIDIEDRVLAWGWGEHGNCGPNTDKKGDVKGKWACIDLPDGEAYVADGVGAGCATSWVWTKPKDEKPDNCAFEWHSKPGKRYILSDDESSCEYLILPECEGGSMDQEEASDQNPEPSIVKQAAKLGMSD